MSLTHKWVIIHEEMTSIRRFFFTTTEFTDSGNSSLSMVVMIKASPEKVFFTTYGSL